MTEEEGFQSFLKAEKYFEFSDDKSIQIQMINLLRIRFTYF